MENNTVLYHHGIKGMKWGVRRFQTKSGGLTDEGRKRYSLGDAIHNHKVKKKRQEAAEKARQAKAAKAEHEKKAVSGKLSVKDMTDDEIRKAIARKQLENSYNSLHPQEDTESKVRKFFKSVGKDVIGPAATSAGKRFLENYLNKVGDSLLKDQVDPNSLESLKSEYSKLDYKVKIKNLKEDLSNPGKSKELSDLEETWKKLDYEKKISDLKKPPKSVAEEIKELEDAIKLRNLKDEELQALKNKALEAEYISKINKAKNNNGGKNQNDEDKDDKPLDPLDDENK